MEETIITDSSLSNSTYEYVDYGGASEHTCFIVPELKAIAAVCIAVSLCGLVGNGLVLWFLGCSMKRNRFTLYTESLAVTDLCMLLLWFLLMLAVLSFSVICLNGLISFYVQFVYEVVLLSQYLVLTSLCFLAAMSMEQSLAVFFPAWCHCHRPKHCSGIVFCMILALNGLFSVTPYLSSTGERAYPGVAIAICTILSSLMLVSSLALFIKLRCGSQRQYPRKLHVAVLISMLLFFVFGIPFTVEDFLYLPHSYALFPEMTSLTPFLLASLNSSIRPVLYFLLGSCRQRRSQCSLKVALQRVFAEGVRSEERRQEPGDAVEESIV
ncbi:mas-related G-protein coupled receptor member X1-like [Pogoniulus pusillus]|uniref:mas-related G-protein coupled receptor member X1-like n=1 Tax=Pogoniulus pusillus TaxID=488313 RepID=UPI0030B98012